MKVKILGTRGEIPESAPYHAKQSGILIDEELLLDVGEKEFLKYGPQWILISHFHPDHAYFVRHGHEEIPDTHAKIFAPEKLESGVKIHILNKRKRLGAYTITPIPTHHSKHVKSQGYLVLKEGRSLLYTADLVWINKEYHPLFKCVDLVITEASFLRKGGMIRRDKETGGIYGHTGVPNLIHLFKECTPRILFIHFGAWFYKNAASARRKIESLGKEQGVHLLIGYDGMEIDI